MTGKGGAGKGSRSEVAEVQSMARHVLRIALVPWLSGQQMNWLCNLGEATK
jgi:hypothetical protein